MCIYRCIDFYVRVHEKLRNASTCSISLDRIVQYTDSLIYKHIWISSSSYMQFINVGFSKQPT